MNTTMFAVDTAKAVMQLHWVEPSGEVHRKKLTRAKFVEFFAQRAPGRVVLEACGGAHHWGRRLAAQGHRVELLPPHQVRGFVRGNKDDAADARAIWVAGQQRDIRRVPVKSVEQQAVLALHRTRAHWITVRTATVNSLRGLLYEFGVVLPKGREGALAALRQGRAAVDEQLPPLMVHLVDEQLRALQELDRSVRYFDAQIAQVQNSQQAAIVLREIPGIGVLGATALAAWLGDGSAWRNGREFSACIGLVPRHSGTGGTVRIGHLSKRGDPYLRTLLISGARSVLSQAHPPAWASQLLLRRPFNVVVVALANKMARTAWALIAHGRTYDGQWRSTPPNQARTQPAT